VSDEYATGAQAANYEWTGDLRGRKGEDVQIWDYDAARKDFDKSTFYNDLLSYSFSHT